MISSFSKVLGDAGINISDMTNKSKGNYAYTLLDVQTRPYQEVIEKLEKIDGV